MKRERDLITKSLEEKFFGKKVKNLSEEEVALEVSKIKEQLKVVVDTLMEKGNYFVSEDSVVAISGILGICLALISGGIEVERVVEASLEEAVYMIENKEIVAMWDSESTHAGLGIIGEIKISKSGATFLSTSGILYDHVGRIRYEKAEEVGEE